MHISSSTKLTIFIQYAKRKSTACLNFVLLDSGLRMYLMPHLHLLKGVKSFIFPTQILRRLAAVSRGRLLIQHSLRIHPLMFSRNSRSQSPTAKKIFLKSVGQLRIRGKGKLVLKMTNPG
jgi:hypothetical protein